MASSGFYTYTEDTGLITPDVQNLLTEVQSEYQSAFGSSLILNGNTPQGVLINAEVLARVRTLQLNCTLANQINPGYAGGVFLDALIALTNPAGRVAATSTLVPVVLTGAAGTTVVQGSFVQDTSGNLYTIQTTVVLNSGSTTVFAQAVATGPITVAPKTVTIIVTNTLGWETVNNPTAQSYLGTTTQSDTQARQYRNNTLAQQGQSLSEAITSGVYAIPSVTSLWYQQNDSSSPQTINNVYMIPNSIYLCVSGGDVYSIASVLNAKKSGGCAYNNSGVYMQGPASTIGFFSLAGTLTGSFSIAGCTTTNNSQVITSVSSTSGVFIGQSVSGTGIVSGSTVTGFTSNTITISIPAAADGTGISITMGASPLFLVSDTSNTFVGQTITGTGIPAGTTITAIDLNTSLTMSAVPTAGGSITATMGDTPFITGIIGSPTIYIGGVVTDFYGYVPQGSTVVSVINPSTVQISNLVTGTSGYVAAPSITVTATSATLTGFSGGNPTTGIMVGQAVYGPGIPVGASVLSLVTDTSVTMTVAATATTASTTVYFGDVINIYAGTPQGVPLTDPFSGQLVDVLFDTPAAVPIAVQVTAHANSSIRNVISVIQDAVVSYANGGIMNDPGLGVGVDVSCFAIAGAINISEPSIYIVSVKTSTIPVVSYSDAAITIQPFQQATIQASAISVVLV